MANIKKSYNFREGVQVDNNNFIVTPSGLVGIGTSIPTETLDVSGDIKASGFVTASQVTTQSLNVTSTSQFNRINVGIVSITSGIVTYSSGIVTYYGDGGRLLNLPTSQWLDVDSGLGFTSIYAQGFVGVSTNMPRFALQVGGNGNTSLPSFQRGVGISSNGDILCAGILTTVYLNATDVNISGVATGTFSGNGSGLTSLNASQLSSGKIPNNIFPANFSVTGVVTASTFVGNLTGTATTAVGIVTTSNVTVNSIKSEGVIANDYVAIGTDSTNYDLHVRRSTSAVVQVTSTSADARLVIGRDIILNQNNGEIRFGNTDGAYAYSTSDSLDILNYDTGAVNYYLNVQGGTSNWNWIYGSSNVRMQLTYDGKLGIGTVAPSNTLYVVGTSTVTSNSWVGGNLSVIGDLTSNGDFSSDTAIIANSVGVSTNNATATFQVGGNPSFGQKGFTVSSTGNIRFSGILTATSIDSVDGDFSGIVTASAFNGNGNNLVSLNATNIATGTLSNSLFPQNLDISGIVTAGIITASTLYGDGENITGLNASNITTGTLNAARFPESFDINGIGTCRDGVSTGIGTISITVTPNSLTFTNVGTGSSVTLTLS